MPGRDQPVELQYLLLDATQLSPECRKTCTSYLWNSLVVWIGDDSEQFLDTAAPDRCNDPELGKMGPDCIPLWFIRVGLAYLQRLPVYRSKADLVIVRPHVSKMPDADHYRQV